MGAQLYRRAQSLEPLDDDPNLNGEHHGSAYQMGWYGYAQKDLRRLLGRRVRGPLSRVYCGGSKTRQGTRRKCQSRLRASLKRALNQDPGAFYKDKTCEDYEMPSNQWCYDAVRQRPGRSDQPATDPLDQPADVPAGGRDPEEGAALAGAAPAGHAREAARGAQLAAHSVERRDAAAGAEQEPLVGVAPAEQEPAAVLRPGDPVHAALEELPRLATGQPQAEHAGGRPPRPPACPDGCSAIARATPGSANRAQDAPAPIQDRDGARPECDESPAAARPREQRVWRRAPGAVHRVRPVCDVDGRERSGAWWRR